MQHDIELHRGAPTLRPLVRENAPALRAIVDEQSWAGMSVPLPATDDAKADHLASLIDQDGLLAFAVEKYGRLVGRTTFYDRVALRCDHRTTRSHAAILKVGATFEGTLRRFRRAADGTITDADYFSVLVEEWPRVRERLLARLDVARTA